MNGIDKKYIIAITANTSWYLYNFRKNTILSLLENGYQVIAISPADEYTRRLNELGCKTVLIKIDSGGTNFIKDSMTLLSAWYVLRKEKVDVVLNFTPKNNIYFTLAAKVLNIPAINNVAGLGSVFMSKGIVRIICGNLYRFSQRYAAKIFFQNEDDRELFLTEMLPDYLYTERLPGSGVDLVRFNVTPAPDDGVVRFTLIARMLYSKGVEHYVDAARKLKKRHGHLCEFRLLGFLDVNNPAAVKTERMAAWIEEGNILYLGTSDNVEQEIAQVDCIVLPSFYREGVPKSLLEAAAMGKPLITTRNIGCQDTVDHGVNGFLCEPQDTGCLTQAMEELINLTHEQRLQMGNESRKKMVREFDEKIVISRYLMAIKQVLP
ncbi:glycosyl transferase family 1 [Rahnella victoriana]|uniref:glycosyltransferase family 4 protein n=1 Tax=Rahnella victoriana TaxID=1510570 RepID=UPI000BB1AEAD|nr:glycosyltransferase family 4 protein [Rahnella victoriana]PBI82515.1 glycosyl transferase family 1 [Rahnella victoriana]